MRRSRRTLAGGFPARLPFACKLLRRCEVHNLALPDCDQPGGEHARDNKHERPEVKTSLDESDEETGLSIDLADDRPNIEQEMLRRERLRAIRKHVEALPERQRMAVMMHKYQELDYRQIAEVLHLSESATKSLLFRAYETLRQSLKDFV